MPNQEHVCIAITKTEPMGGAQKYVLTLATELASRGHKVTVVAGGTGALFAELDKAGIQYRVLRHSQRDISFLREIFVMKELYAILREIRPDVLHLNSSKLGGIGSVVGRMSGIRTVVFTAHGWAFNENRPSWQKAVFYLLYWITIVLCNRTICVSQETRRQILALPFIRKKLDVIYNGIRIPDFVEREVARNRLGEQFPELDPEKKWVGVLAELHPIKGHDILLDAIAGIRNDLEHYQIVCMGTGELMDELKERTSELSLENQVFFTGFIQNASSYLRAFDFVVLPSRSEAMPLTVIEAGFAEVPVIASRVGGIPEVITDGHSGFLFTRENADELSGKIKIVTALTPEHRRDITNSLRQKLSPEFTVDNMVTRTLSTYRTGKQADSAVY